MQKMLTFCPASFAQLRHGFVTSFMVTHHLPHLPSVHVQHLRSSGLCKTYASWEHGRTGQGGAFVLLISTKFHSNLIDILHTEIKWLDDWWLSNAAETDETRLWRVNALHPRWIRNPWAVVQLWGLPKLSGCAFSMCRSCFGALLPRMLEVSSHSCGCQLCWKGSTVDQWGCATLPCEPSPGWNVLWSDGQMFPAC